MEGGKGTQKKPLMAYYYIDMGLEMWHVNLKLQLVNNRVLYMELRSQDISGYSSPFNMISTTKFMYFKKGMQKFKC